MPSLFVQRNLTLSRMVSLATFLFFALMLSAPRGYAVGVVLLLACSLYYVVAARGDRPPLGRPDRIMIGLMLLVFLMGLATWAYHGEELSELDLFTRYLFSALIFLLLLACPPRMSWLWAGLVVGCVSAACVATWQRLVVEDPRAFGFTGGIQFGDLGLTMGILCAVAMVWCSQYAERKTAWRVALFIGMLCGLYVSLMSGSRGGWVAVPAVIVIFCAAFLRRSNIRWAMGIMAVLLVGLTFVAMTLPMVEMRYEQAVEDINQFQEGNPDTSLGRRLDLWQALVDIIPQKPWMGWSVHDYAAEKQRLVQAGNLKPRAARLANAHNTFLEVWLHNGLVTLVPLLALLGYAAIQFGRRIRDPDCIVQLAATAGLTLVVCYIIFSQTQVMLGRNNTLTFFLITLMIFWAIMRAREAQLRDGTQSSFICN